MYANPRRSYACPKCGQTELTILASISCDLIQGEDEFRLKVPAKNPAWSDKSLATCRSCGHSAESESFYNNEPFTVITGHNDDHHKLCIHRHQLWAEDPEDAMSKAVWAHSNSTTGVSMAKVIPISCMRGEIDEAE